MKVERKQEFTPVTITIESQEELDYLYTCLNSTTETIRKNKNHLPPMETDPCMGSISGLGQSMFSKINSLYN